MACCDVCGNFDDSHYDDMLETYQDIDRDAHQPDLYYYWDAPIEEDYSWRDSFPLADCLCEVCFDIANSEGKIKWKCAS
jgi:hypothetical protein